MDTTQEFLLSRRADDLEKGETILAVMTTMRDGTVERRCADCEREGMTPTPTGDKELLTTLEEFGYIASDTIVRVDILTERYDDLWSDNGYLFLGKVCQECHCTLGYWHVCRFCGAVTFPGDGEHTCLYFNKEDEPSPGFFEDVMDGFEDSYQEDGFIEDVL